jgi:hypothetical protein
MTQEEILILSDKRYKLLEERLDGLEYDYDPIEIDQLAEQILKAIKDNKENLTFEFIFEELTKIGWAPCLLYDDNGRFAISGDGFQTVPEDSPADISMMCFVEKDYWKDSIREALYYFLDK